MLYLYLSNLKELTIYGKFESKSSVLRVSLFVKKVMMNVDFIKER